MMCRRSVLGLMAVVGLGAAAVGLATREYRSATDQPKSSDTAVTNTTQIHSYTNRLADEKSPYLLQHQHNPVDWYPWGEEAFARAQEESKPIFLSIGYSTCHWCHVMERESFEDEEIAAFLNRHFVSIKVDREERPDVDRIYMTFVQAVTGGGGWPMSVFLTPDRKPFFGGTYFPPENRHGQPAFLQVLHHIHSLWTERRPKVLESAGDITSKLAGFIDVKPASSESLSGGNSQRAARFFMEEYDPEHGGFGQAPKFPRPTQPSFLLAYGVRRGDREAVKMVLHTCRAMARGGIYDQLGGGFSRYSVDAEWLVPHFEKMLYDNAQLVGLYIDAYRVSGEAFFLEVAKDIVRYVLRDMTHPEGGFYSAEDADSEGKEGKFYCWTLDEVKAFLSPEEFEAAVAAYGLTAAGNFVDHSDPDPLRNQNVLHRTDVSLDPEEQEHLASAREVLFRARCRRIRPQRDDKVLTSWNGMMLGALAQLYAVTGAGEFREAAERNLDFLKRRLYEPSSQTLYHRWREGERDEVQLLAAYAFLLGGVVDLYEATLEPRHLEFAVDLAEAMIAKFYDSQAGGFWQTIPDGSQLFRMKDDYDGAEPSGNSAAILALARLGAITGRKDFVDAADRSLEFFAHRLESLPHAVPLMLRAMNLRLHEPVRVVVSGDPGRDGTRELLRRTHGVYLPARVILGTAGPVEATARSIGESPSGKEPAAYVCRGTTCQPAVSDPEALAELLGKDGAQDQM